MTYLNIGRARARPTIRRAPACFKATAQLFIVAPVVFTLSIQPNQDHPFNLATLALAS